MLAVLPPWIRLQAHGFQDGAGVRRHLAASGTGMGRCGAAGWCPRGCLAMILKMVDDIIVVYQLSIALVDDYSLLIVG